MTLHACQVYFWQQRLSKDVASNSVSIDAQCFKFTVWLSAVGKAWPEDLGLAAKMLQQAAERDAGLLQACIDEALRLRAEGNKKNHCLCPENKAYEVKSTSSMSCLSTALSFTMLLVFMYGPKTAVKFSCSQ
jgi:hypothetical protein